MSNERSYWLHRIRKQEGEFSIPLLEKDNFLSIGCYDLSDRNFVDQCRDDWNKFELKFKNVYQKLYRSRYSLWRFIYEMKKGDYVVVPMSGKFHIYEFEDDNVLTQEDKDISCIKFPNGKFINYEVVDLGFFRKVKPVIKDVERGGAYAGNRLTARMKVLQTNVKCDNIKNEIDETIKAFNSDSPINIQKIILKETVDRTLEILRKNLVPNKFEKLIRLYFERLGATVDNPLKNEPNKEGDADVVATFDEIKTSIYIQAKLHEGTTDKWAVDQIKSYTDNIEALENSSDLDDSEKNRFSKIGWVISTADNFSPECYREASKHDVILIGGKEFAKMLLETGISNLGDLNDD